LKFEANAKGDPFRTGSDSTKARTVLGWNPQTTVDDGMVKMFDWAKQL
jgi:nucleoside-diphosphate-sugar epimerase